MDVSTDEVVAAAGSAGLGRRHENGDGPAGDRAV
jgi:hypothetical protein